jgi:hypothetical protein
MKVCGFTIVRNAVKFGYPVVEAINSILPLVDKMIVAVGNSDDGTGELIKSLPAEKIVIVDTVWDDNLNHGGHVLAVETDKAMDAIPDEYDWCIYIQADEVIHEKYHDTIRREMQHWKDHSEVEGLLFRYLHFWGTFDYVGVSRKWYNNEIRIIRNNKRIRSYKDAQGFRIDGRKLKVKPIDAYVYHYGWVRPPDTIKAKMRNFSQLYFTGNKLKGELNKITTFDYSNIDAVKLFEGTHPEVMHKLISNMNWHVQLDESKISFSPKYFILHKFEKYFGYRLFEYKNYKIIP